MSYQVLARKYRPQRFADVIGQDHVTRTLKNALEQGRIAHGYIFSGHRGIGKTTIARILAMCLNCRSTDRPVTEPCGVCDSCTEIRAGNAVDVIEIDAATNRGIDEIRELRDATRYRPARDRYKVWILDEAHQITDAAFNALLKTLEEPPSHVVFMMATTQPEDIPQTIRSRCQHFSFHAVRFAEIVEQLRDIAGREGIAADEDALAVLAEAGDGSMRDALSIMDQAIACCASFAEGKPALTAEQVRGLIGTVSSETLEEVMNAVVAGASDEMMRIADRLMTEGQSPAHFARQLVRFLRNAVMARVAGAESPLLQISTDERARVNRVAGQFSEEEITRFLQIMLRTHADVSYRQEQRFHLELGLLKLVHAQRLLPVEELLSGMSVQAQGTRPASGGAPPAPARPPVASQPATPRSSPFDTDRARKSFSSSPATEAAPTQNPAQKKMSAGSEVVSSTPITIGATAAVALEAVAAPVAETEEAPHELASVPTEGLRLAITAALEGQGQRAAAAKLDESEWVLSGNELAIRVPLSDKMTEVVVNPDARRIAQAEASRAAGRPLKVKITGGGTAQDRPQSQPIAAGNGSTDSNARSRASQDPVVQRMQEKFGAEVRTVIDQRNRK